MFSKETLEQKSQEEKKEMVERQDQEDTNVIPFTLIQGGKGGGTGDWLTPLPDKCFFIAESTSKSSDVFSVCMLFRIEWSGRSSKLLRATTKINLYKNNSYEYFYVLPSSFCKKWNLVEVLGVVEVEEEEGVEEDV